MNMYARMCTRLPVLLPVIWVLGCAEGHQDRYTPAERLVRSKVFHIDDVPMPNGFKKLPKSYGSLVGGVRSQVHYYEGPALRKSVLNFYQAEMPDFGWVEVALQDVDDEYTLRYEKKVDQCEIRIRDDGRTAKVRVVITPLRRAPTGTGEDQRP
jgi:hypothetical protein